MKKLVIASLLSGLGLLSVNSVLAGTVTSNFQTTSTLNSTCVISAQDVNLGALNFLQTPGNVFYDGGLSVLCSKGVAYTITPDGGYTDGLQQLLTGTGTNKDEIEVRLFKGDGVTGWKRTATGPITANATGTNEAIPIKVLISGGFNPKASDATATNSLNSTAQPDNYSATISARITY